MRTREEKDRNTDYTHDYRAKLSGTFVEPVERLQVYLRDKWVCQLCFHDVDPDLEYPDPKSASLDHIISVSNGGEHSYANVRLAHLTCNQRKGGRVWYALDVAQRY